MAAKEWDLRHPKTDITKNQGIPIPSFLYTDENPATTIKGTGFKDKRTAERTILLTSQKGVRYKQYWTIRAMRERAVYHPKYPTPGMQEAVKVFDEWLKDYDNRPPLCSQEQIEREAEWNEYKKLCKSAANNHSYSGSPSKQDLKRARDDLKCARDCLVRGLEFAQSQLGPRYFSFPLTAFTSIFGGPGIHGYGRHHIISQDGTVGGESLVEIDGADGLQELVPRNKIFISSFEKVTLHYNRKSESAKVEIKYIQNRTTIKNLWDKFQPKAPNDIQQQQQQSKAAEVKRVDEPSSWICDICTFDHVGKAKSFYLVCELCGSSRKQGQKKMKKKNKTMVPSQSTQESTIPAVTAWGSLRPPTDRDIQGPRKRHKALDAPPPVLDYLVVMDLEWTADDKKKMEPIAEITQLPSIVMRLIDRKWGSGLTRSAEHDNVPSNVVLPLDISMPCEAINNLQDDAFAISGFDTFVRPTLNPTLTKFSIELTAITQEQVDAAPCIEVALKNYMDWLQSLDLVDPKGVRKGNWCFCTWSDADIIVLRQELEYKGVDLPPCFDRWVNLKQDSMFKKHYGREPKGGLRSCVESIGAIWDGRAHNGLVDSLNTAKIVRHMVQTGFRFTRSTRGLDKNGLPYGQKKK